MTGDSSLIWLFFKHFQYLYLNDKYNYVCKNRRNCSLFIICPTHSGMQKSSEAIMRTRPCNIQIILKFKKNEKCQWNSFDIFFIFDQRTDAVLTCTHNLCFKAKIRKKSTPLHTPVLLHKSRVQGGILFLDMFSWCEFLVRFVCTQPILF